ncbi:MAG TPA: M28 family peptidase [bacterium]|nr:M28 family peptidase [bacterium]
MIPHNTVSQAHLTEFNRTIAGWTRLSGTSDEREATAYVEERLRSFGYASTTILHDAYISLPREAALRITRPESREVFCITHSMGIPTGAQPVSAELVYAGKGTPEEYARAGAAGKVALVEGRATPAHAVAATRAGALGIICISGRHAHEMCCSPVWGNPSESAKAQLPRVHLLSVNKADGEGLRDLCARGRADVEFTARVETGWTKTPIVVGDLAAGHHDADSSFVLFSGHLDSWYLGAMDNGSANAAMLEVARVLAPRKASFRRGLRLAFWSGHSHGRYSSSAWYADTNWFELAERCVCHVNVDSLGGIDADTFATNSMPETAPLGIWAVKEAAGAVLDAKRVGRNSDQSFLGAGVPSLLGSVSHQADGSLGWWWHTPHDTLDKIDAARLVRDTKIFVLALSRLLENPVLPLDYAAAARDLRQSLEDLAAAVPARESDGGFDLRPATAAAARLEELCGRLSRAAQPVTGGAPARHINACLRQLGRTLIPATYTATGPYGHDAALETTFLPRLHGARRLATLPPDGDEAKFLRVDLVRGRNAVTAAIQEACRHVEACLERLG